MVIVPRKVYPNIQKSLFKGKAVILYGARQVGKTTLVNRLREEYKDKSLLLNCDEPEARRSLTDVSSRQLTSLVGNSRLVIIDEAQRVKNIGLTLKLFVDTLPHIQVVATGSSSFDLANEVVEPLTGRAYEFTLYPLALQEMSDLFASHQWPTVLAERLVFGMYPEVILKPSEAPAILKTLTGGYLYKDILAWQRIKNPEMLEKLLQALALQIGQEVSYNELATLLGIDKQTVSSYIQLLEKAFVIFRLRPFHRNVRTELRKLRKIYFYDVGIRNALIDNLNPLNLRQDVGALWENWVISERLKTLHNNGQRPRQYFWRTHAQQEIDYLEEDAGILKAFEFKWSDQNLRVPKAFATAYPETHVTLINRDNAQEFLLGE